MRLVVKDIKLYFLIILKVDALIFPYKLTKSMNGINKVAKQEKNKKRTRKEQEKNIFNFSK